MRYSPATGDPNDFKDHGFTLCQVHYDPPRRTELFIVMAMYNEDGDLFTRAMHGVMKNIGYLRKRDRSKTWSEDDWKKVVVCIVSDGRQKIDWCTLSVMTAIGAYQESIAANVVKGKPVATDTGILLRVRITDACSASRLTSSVVSVTPSSKIEGAEKGIAPVRITFCLEEKSRRRSIPTAGSSTPLDPFFKLAFCVLLDVGTIPGPGSAYHLRKAFDIN